MDGRVRFSTGSWRLRASGGGAVLRPPYLVALAVLILALMGALALIGAGPGRATPVPPKALILGDSVSNPGPPLHPRVRASSSTRPSRTASP